MGKDRVDLLKWTNEQFNAEYELIKQKKSKLPASQRATIVRMVEEESKNIEIVSENENTETPQQ